MANSERNHRKKWTQLQQISQFNYRQRWGYDKEYKRCQRINKYNINIGPNLTGKKLNRTKSFENFLPPLGKSMEHKDLSFEEFEDFN